MATGQFFWGAGGQKLTQDQIDNQRKILAALVQRGDPAFNNAGWLGALGRGLEGAYEGWQDSKLKAEQNDLNEYNTNTLGSRLNEVAASLTGGSSMPSAASTGVGQELAATSPSIDPSSISPDIKNGIAETASALGIDPVDLATAISYETGGTFDPVKSGPTTQWGQHRGLIQFGEPQAAEYGVDWNNPVGSQLGANGAVANYLRKAGVEPGMGMMDIYSAINAGRVGRYGASDANNGGAPGTVADKVNQQMGGHRANALALFGGQINPSAAAIETVAPASGYVDPMVSAPNALPSAEVANALMGPLPAARNVAAAPAVASQPVQMAQATPPRMGFDPRILAVLNDPRANEQTRNMAKLLIDQQQGQQAAAQKQYLAEQQRQQEIARRQSIAQQAGINPAYAVDDELWKGAAGNLFAAPSTSTVGSTVIDNRTGQPIYQGTPENPTSVQEYEYAKNQGYEGTYAQYQSDMKRASANNTTINTGEGNKFYNTLDEKNAATFSGLSDTGMQARSTLAQVDQLGSLLERVPTGATAVLKQAAGEYGINTEGLDDIQAATALINRLVPSQRQPGSGSMSDQDLALFKQSLPRLINQPGGNATIVNTLKAISQYQIDQGSIADRVANREITPAEGRQAIASLPNPLAGFKPPEAGKESQGWSNVTTDIPGVTIRRKN